MKQFTNFMTTTLNHWTERCATKMKTTPSYRSSDNSISWPDAFCWEWHPHCRPLKPP